MSKGKFWFVLIPLILALFQFNCFVFAGDNEVTRETLRGLQGVGIGVVVEPLKWVVEQAGLTTDQLRNDTELKLRLAGINVISSEESLEVPGRPFLYVNPRVIKYGSLDRYIFHIGIELSQGVSLLRTPKVKASVTTWSVSVIGTSHKLVTIRDQVKELVDVFINAYLSVNPK